MIMGKIAERLKKRLESMTQEELDAKWEELKKWNEIGPTVNEYFEELKNWNLCPKELENETI